MSEKQKLLTPSQEFIKKRRREKTRQTVIDVSFGLMNKVSELVLTFIMFNEELVKSGGLHGNAARNFTRRLMDEYPEVDIKQWLEGLRTVRKRRWIDASGEITREGKERLQNLFPKLYPEKHWDGSWYVVNFDIPETLRGKREILRTKLKSLGFAMLQQSTWISPVNFLGTVQKEVESLEFIPYVVCLESKNLGEEDSRVLANRIWHLNDLNEQYGNFILKYEKGIAKDKFPSMFMEFMAVLQNDPQLPVELLSQKWCGREAYRLVQEFYLQSKFSNRYAKTFFSDGV